LANLGSIYADYNSTTPLCKPVIDAFNKWQGRCGNMSSPHHFGQAVHAIYDSAIDTILDLLNGKEYSLFTCSSATEAHHWLFYSLLDCQVNRPVVISSEIEHPCVLEPLRLYEKRGLISLKLCKVNSDGIVDLDHLDSLLDANVCLVSIMYANNEIGTIQPLKQIAKMAHAVGALVHSDIVQAAGKLPVDLNELNVDMVTMSAHKCYAPVGCGVLLIKDSGLLRPFLLGGSQQQKLRAGTVNVMGLDLFAQGLRYCYDQLPNHLNIHKWGQLLIDRVSFINTVVPINNKNLLWNTLPLVIESFESYDVMMKFDMLGVGVATGSACSTGAVDVSPVIKALNVPFELVNGVIRLSFGYMTTVAELDELTLFFDNF